MPSLDARGIASLLREYAQRTALRGANPYRANAYSRAADSLAALAVPLDVLIAEDRLAERCREDDPKLPVIYETDFSPVAPRPVPLMLQQPYRPEFR